MCHTQRILASDPLSSIITESSIFVPSEGNALVDILLLRGVNGESPVKKRTPRKKSTRTLKTRPPAAASRVAGSKTPRAGAPKRASRKPAAAPRDADENDPPLAKKRRNTSKRAKLSEGRRTPGAPLCQVAVRFASLTLHPVLCALYKCAVCFFPRRHGHWSLCRPFSAPYHCPASALCRSARRCQCVLLYHYGLTAMFNSALSVPTVNCVKTPTAPDSSPASKKVKPSATTAPPPLGKSERAVGKCNAQAAAALPPPHPAELEPSGPVSEGTARKVKSPLFLLLEKRQREKHDDQRRAGGVAAAPSELAKSFAPHESDGGESDDSDAPLAMKLDKRAPAVAESRTKLNKGKGNAPQPPTKRRSKAKALERGVGLPDEAANRGETIAPPKAKKGSAAAEERAADPGTVALAVGKVARDVDADLPPPPPTHTGANSGVRKKVQVLQEKTAPANAPRKRKERIKTLLEPSAKDEHEHEPSRKKSRRADPSTSRCAVLFLFTVNSSLSENSWSFIFCWC